MVSIEVDCILFLQEQIGNIHQVAIYNVSSSECEDEKHKNSDDEEFGADVTESSGGSPSASPAVS